MANTKNALLRAIVIDRCLSDKKRKYSTQDLMIECNKTLSAHGMTEVLSPNTIREDIEAIKERWFVDVRMTVEGRNRFYSYADPSFSIFNSHISHEQKEKFKMALKLLHELEAELFR